MTDSRESEDVAENPTDDSESVQPPGESSSSSPDAGRQRLAGALHDEQLYVPVEGEPQLTFRAVFAGCLVGSIVACTNIYIGLKIGWTFGASIVSAVLGFALFRALGRTFSVLETNITQTAGSGAGAMASAAGLVAAIPAMQLLGHDIAWWQLSIWTFSIAFLGVFFAVPLRRQMVVNEKLRFPTGTATASTVVALLAEAKEASAKARVLLIAALVAGVLTLTSHFVPEVESPPLHEWLGIGVLATLASWGFTVYLGPALFGAGFLIGPRVSLSLVLGAVVAWGLLGPWVQDAGWADGPVMSYAEGPRGWLLWPGVALMVSEALATLAFSWRTFLRALMPARRGEGTVDPTPESERIPTAWWVGGLAVGIVLATLSGWLVFDIQWWLTVLAIGLSSILAIVAVRSTGETDINPVGGMGKVTQLVYGGLAPGQIGTNLMAAAVTGAGASQAADMMQDLKTGYLLGASPRKQFLSQLVGICAGIVLVVPAYYLITGGYELGSEQMPAPAAMAWKAMAELLTEGFDALPPHAVEAVAVAGGFGVLFAALRRVDAVKMWIPSGLACGIAFIVPAFYSFVMFYGLVAWWIWRKVAPSQVERFNFALASGLVVGEGLMGLVKAALGLLGIGGGH